MSSVDPSVVSDRLDSSLRREFVVLVRLGWPLSVSSLAIFAPRLAILGWVGHMPDGARHVAACGIGIM